MVIGLLVVLVYDVRFFDERHFRCGLCGFWYDVTLNDRFTPLFLAHTLGIDFDFVFRIGGWLAKHIDGNQGHKRNSTKHGLACKKTGNENLSTKTRINKRNNIQHHPAPSNNTNSTINGSNKPSHAFQE
jgi:hypothetical protein